MNRFIKTFVDDSTKAVSERANEFAEAENLIIVSAQLSFSGGGRLYEAPVLTVVYERCEPKTRRSRKKPEEAEVSDA